MNTLSPFILSSVLAHVKSKNKQAIHQGAYRWKLSRVDFCTKQINSELRSVKNSLENITNHLKEIEDNLK